MTRPEKQIQRMKRFFIDAAKEIIRGEGTKALSVRNIAERAGYSYATMYNYFPDLTALIAVCTKEFSRECGEYVRREAYRSKDNYKNLVEIVKAYCKFFVLYPALFEMIFLEKSSSTAFKNEKYGKNVFFLDSINEEWNKLFAGDDESGTKKIMLANFVHGWLLSELTSPNLMDYGNFLRRSEELIGIFIRRMRGD